MRRSEIDLEQEEGTEEVRSPARPGRRSRHQPVARLRDAATPVFPGRHFHLCGPAEDRRPGFLQPGSSTYIETQLQAYAAHSPIGFFVQAFGLATPQLTG